MSLQKYANPSKDEQYILLQQLQNLQMSSLTCKEQRGSLKRRHNQVFRITTLQYYFERASYIPHLWSIYVVYPGTRYILLGTYLLHIAVQYTSKMRDIGCPFEVVLQGCDTELFRTVWYFLLLILLHKLNSKKTQSRTTPIHDDKVANILLGTYLLHIAVQYPPKRRDIWCSLVVVLQGCDTENLIVTSFETTTLFFAC
jgi:hypothetical protein